MKKIIRLLTFCIVVMMFIPTSIAATYSLNKISKGQYFTLSNNSMKEDTARSLLSDIEFNVDMLVYSKASDGNYNCLYKSATSSYITMKASLDYLQQNADKKDFYIVGSVKTVVGEINGSSSDIDDIVVINGEVINPTITTDQSSVAKFEVNGSGHWQKYNSETKNWDNYYKADHLEGFEEGKYRYTVQVRIENKTHVLDKKCQVKVNKKAWTVDDTLVVEDGYCFLWAYSIEYSAVKKVVEYSIKVVNGTAKVNGKTVNKALSGTTVTIQADNIEDKEFVNWTITGASVKDSNAEETTFTVGLKNIVVTANYQDVVVIDDEGDIDITPIDIDPDEPFVIDVIDITDSKEKKSYWWIIMAVFVVVTSLGFIYYKKKNKI